MQTLSERVPALTGHVRRVKATTVVYAVIALVLLAVLVFNIWRPITVLPRIRLAPGFLLTDTGGASISNETFRGGLTVYSFTHAGCGAACSQTPENIAAFHRTLTELAPADVDLSLVTISVDPGRDTPQTLAAVADQVVPPDSPVPWHFLVGSETATKLVVGGGFEVYFDAEEGNVEFDPRYVLVDSLGIIRAEYRTANPDPNLIARDLDLLTSEMRNSSGVAKVGYEAAHLFVCYPR